MKLIKKGNITSVPGFLASGITAGIKSKGHDLGLIYSETVCVSAGVFTKNLVKAAPVILSQKNIKNKRTCAIIVNSGNANACTGKLGDDHAKKMINVISKELNIQQSSILVASTGKIGESLPIEKITKNSKKLISELTKDGGDNFSKAILTTDITTKSVAIEYNQDRKKIVIGASAKGSGMIYPNMATMLAFIATDANITKSALQEALKRSVDVTYNMITVDGDMSTNDSVFCLANRISSNPTIERGIPLDNFVKALNVVNLHLAKMIVLDGEGATKFITIRVIGTKTFEDAKKIAFSVANSNLVKTAFFGEDPNWGRIISSAGASPELKNSYDFTKADIYFDKFAIVKSGIYYKKSINKDIEKILKKDKIEVTLNLKSGKKEATVFTSDLTYDYVKINAEYST